MSSKQKKSITRIAAGAALLAAAMPAAVGRMA